MGTDREESLSKAVTFRPSKAARKRAAELVAREKEGALSPDETSELEHYLQLEHLMRLAKARARKHPSNELPSTAPGGGDRLIGVGRTG